MGLHVVTNTRTPSYPVFFFCPARTQPQAYQQPPVDPCDVDKQNFGQCLQNNNNDVTSCQFVFEALQTCQMEAKKSYN